MNAPDSNESPQWGWWVGVIFVVQAGLLWWMSTEPVDHVEGGDASFIQIDSETYKGLAMEDPLSLGQPRADGFSSVWLKSKATPHELSRWTPPHVPLSPETNIVETVLKEVLGNQAQAEFRSFQKPPPKLTTVIVPPLKQETMSRLKLAGGLEGRSLASQVTLKNNWNHEVFLKPTRLQMVVDPLGRVLSGVQLAGSGNQGADEMAMTLALKQIRFNALTDGTEYASGELEFHWHTDPNSVTNVMERFPR